jgi:hypothetical protein
MPILLLLFLIVLLPFAILISLPFTLVQRYRMGSARRRARGWLAALNIAAFGLSSLLFLTGAALTSIWAPHAFQAALGGLVAGSVLGLAGVWLSRWETEAGTLHVTPNRWLVLAVTFLVAGRLVYGLWHGWHAWRASGGETPWLQAIGPAGMLAAGAVVLGYYLSYWSGVLRRFRRHQRSLAPARVR